MKIFLFSLFLFPILCFGQVSLGAGLLATGNENIDLGLILSGSVTFKNDQLSSGIKFSKSTIKDVDFTYAQLFIGPHFRNFHVGITFDYSVSKYESIAINNQGIGARFAGYFNLTNHFGILVEANPGFNGNSGKYFQFLVGGFYNFNEL